MAHTNNNNIKKAGKASCVTSHTAPFAYNVKHATCGVCEIFKNSNSNWYTYKLSIPKSLCSLLTCFQK